MSSPASADPNLPDAARERHLSAAARARSPEARLLALEELLARSRVLLEANPAGRAHFLRRNYRSRSVALSGEQADHGA